MVNGDNNMAKKIFFPLLVIVILISFFAILTISKERQNLAESELSNSPSNPSVSSAGNPVVLSATTTKDMNNWVTYSEPLVGFSFLYPPEFQIKKDTSATLILKRNTSGDFESVIKVLKRDLDSNETVNTVSEKDINAKLDKNIITTSLIETITPISIDKVTAITYKLIENQETNTYFYVPTRADEFIEIIILGENKLTSEDISVIDRVVYSFKLQ